MTRQRIASAGLLLASFLVGCSVEPSKAPNQTGEQQTTKPNAPAESFPRILATDVEYYTTGPQQGRPPDGTFPAGTKVAIVQQAGSYTQIRSEDGVEAYVSSDSIKEIEP